MRTKISLFLLLCQWAGAQTWPTTFTPGPSHSQIRILEEKDSLHHYRTRSYRIESATPLSGNPLKDFARSIESVSAVIDLIPLPLSSPPEQELPLIKICADESSFVFAGGPKGAAGFYDGRKQRILILREQFFRTSGSRLGSTQNFNLLVHELAHLRMHHLLSRTQPYFFEGVAEYLAAAHGKAGNFRFTQMEQSIRDHLKERTQSTFIPLTKISKLIRMSPADWHRSARNEEPAKTLELYTSSLLLTHYYFHGGPERQQEIKDYLMAAAKISRRRDPLPVLIHDKDAALIEQRLKSFWAPRGLKLDFR
ncbi:MAG: hypothetical protein ACSHYF_02250 [Verrucomicrobiaceae bacterium]